MDYKDHFKQFEQDPEYIDAEQELKLIFEIADQVLRLRLEKGWSQAELAKHAETKQANISRLESGLNNPSLKFLQKLGRALDSEIRVRFEKSQAVAINYSVDADYQSQEVIAISNWPTIRPLIKNTTSNGRTLASF